MVIIFVILSYFVQGAEEPLCPHIFLKEGSFRLSKNDKLVVCGDKEIEGWKEIPLKQAQFELKLLMQKNGYYSPTFEFKNENLFVMTGPLTRVKAWNLTSPVPVVDKTKKRKVIGEALTSAKIDEIDKWIESELKSNGYPCPTISSSASVPTETIDTRYEPGQQSRIISLERTGISDLDEEALMRFEAFKVYDVYDHRKLRITTNRLITSGIAQSSYYTQKCTPEGVRLIQNISFGEPRVLTIGIGASTEELPFVDLLFKNTRLDRKASYYQLSLHASRVLQRFEATSELYRIPFLKKSFLGPRFKLERNVESSYETASGKVGLDIGRFWDSTTDRYKLRFGINGNSLKTVRGIGPAETSYLSAEGSLDLSSHEYELTTGQQFTGYKTSLSFQGQRAGLGSPLSAYQWTLNGKSLWDVQNQSPPLLILATRFAFGVTNFEQTNGPTTQETLPPEYRFFLGGERDLRGFSRQAINNNGLGYLISAYVGFEIRLIEEIPWNVEPLLLWDGARVGKDQRSFDRAFFQSYGFGARWRSPFGPVRFTFAKGMIQDAEDELATIPQEWVFLFSFGTEF